MKKPNVLFLLVDCLRSDKSVAPEVRDHLPNIHSMIARGVTFPEMITVNSYTLPCVTSIFTGLYPISHGVRSMMGRRLPGRASTLAEIFKESGYNTYASVAGPLEASIGFNRGFDSYRMRSENDEHMYSNWGDEFLNTLRSKFQAPWFAYVHFWEIHQPRQLLADHDHLEFGETLYERAISSWDHELGRILEAVPPNTLVILTGDHGEVIARNRTEDYIDRYKITIRNILKRIGFSESVIKTIPGLRNRLMQFLNKNGIVRKRMPIMIGHGYHAYDCLVRVPFLMMHESLLPVNKLIDKQVLQVDIFPTLVDLLGLCLPKHTPDGQSLVPLLHNKPWSVKPAFIEAGTYSISNKSDKPHLGGVRIDGWKYAYVLDNSDHSEELYNLSTDPTEEHNLSNIELEQKAKLKALAESHFNSEVSEEGDKKNSELTIEEKVALEAKLKDLGYM